MSRKEILPLYLATQTDRYVDFNSHHDSQHKVSTASPFCSFAQSPKSTQFLRRKKAGTLMMFMQLWSPTVFHLRLSKTCRLKKLDPQQQMYPQRSLLECFSRWLKPFTNLQQRIENRYLGNTTFFLTFIFTFLFFPAIRSFYSNFLIAFLSFILPVEDCSSGSGKLVVFNLFGQRSLLNFIYVSSWLRPFNIFICKHVVPK